MTSIDIIFVSVKNETINLTIEPSSDMYSIKTAKEYIMKKMDYDTSTSEVKIIYKGTILKDDINLNDSKYHKEKFVFLKMTKAKSTFDNPPEVKEVPKETPKEVPKEVIKESPKVESKQEGKIIDMKTSEQKSDPYSVKSVLNSILVTSLTGIFSSPETYLQILTSDPVYQNLILRDRRAFERLINPEFVKNICKEMSQLTGIKFVVETENTSATIEGNTINETPLNVSDNDTFNTWLGNQTNENRQLINKFPQPQQVDIMNLCIMGYNLFDVIQLYPLSGYNVEATLELLNNN
jgi:hypothetical protein